MRMIAKLVVRYRLAWAMVTMLLQLGAIVAVVFVFPNVSNLWVSIFVLVSGFTASVTALGDLLVETEDQDTVDEERG